MFAVPPLIRTTSPTAKPDPPELALISVILTFAFAIAPDPPPPLITTLAETA